MRKLINSLVIIIATTVCISCTAYKDVPYFQNVKTNTTEKIANFTPITIQPQDIIGVNVVNLNPEAAAIFNSNLNRINGNNLDVSATNPIIGYLVDQNGNIQFPTVGAMKVAGLTTSEVQAKILEKIGPSMKQPSVTVRIMNFKISVLGDVAKPGIYPVTNERITVTEALGLAGDLNITALRKNVLLVREINGERKFIPVDLTSEALFSSPNYYLKNNDVIVVQPGKVKYAQVSRGYQTTTILLSALSIAALVFTAFK